LYDRLHLWAESGWAGPATAAWCFLQGSVVPGPSDALFVPLGLSEPRRAFRLAAWATAGAVLGGFVAYGLGRVAFDALVRPALAAVSVGPEDWFRLQRLFDEHGPWLIALSSISPFSTKLMCIAAGAFRLSFAECALALFLGRGVRFATIAIVLRYAGDRLAERFGLRRNARPA